MKQTKVQKIVRRWRGINERAICIGNNQVEKKAFCLSVVEELDYYRITYQNNEDKIFVQVEKSTNNLLPLCCIFAVYATEMKKIMKNELRKHPHKKLKRLYKELKSYNRILLEG